MPDLLRRVAVLSIISLVGIALLAPLTARSALPVQRETQRLLELADAPPSTLDRGGSAGREWSAALSLAQAPAPAKPEVLASEELGAPPSVSMEATLYVVSTPPPKPAPVRRTAGSSMVDGSVWDRLAQCESGGNWSINTGNGYYGGLQFSHSTWHAYGGGEFADYAHQATREQQIIVAQRLHAQRGFQPWPACRIKLGLP